MTPSDYKAIREAVAVALVALTARQELAVTDDEYRYWEKRAQETNAALTALEKYKPKE